MEKLKPIKVIALYGILYFNLFNLFAQESRINIKLNDSLYLSSSANKIKSILVDINNTKVLNLTYWPNDVVESFIIKQNEKRYLRLGFNYVGILISQKEYILVNDTLMPNGSHYHYTDEGILSHIYIFKNGKLDGMFRSYYENGKLKQFGNYKDESKRGKWIKYSKEGSILKIENYD